jgi:hypothetical protein
MKQLLDRSPARPNPRPVRVVRPRPWRATAAGFLAVVFSASVALPAEPPSTGPYAPYAFLIGEWNVAPEGGGPASLVMRFRWGPNHSYIWYAASLLVGGSERPHFEGLLLWNGVHKNLDMLLSLDLERGLIQEQGEVSVQPDGTILRNITAFYSEGAHPLGQEIVGPAGATARFRQTFKQVGADRVLTSVLRDSGGTWVATFPGSDHLAMTRREKA